MNSNTWGIIWQHRQKNEGVLKNLTELSPLTKNFYFPASGADRNMK